MPGPREAQHGQTSGLPNLRQGRPSALRHSAMQMARSGSDFPGLVAVGGQKAGHDAQIASKCKKTLDNCQRCVVG
jgi:hypothetical protein